MIGVGDAVLYLRGDLENLKTGLQQAGQMTKNRLKEMAGHARQLGIAFTAIGGSVVAGLGVAVSAFAIQEKAETQLAATLQSTGHAAGLTAEQLKTMAAELQQMTTYGDEAVIGAESLLLTFTNIGGQVFPDALQTVLDMSTALGQDLKSSSIQLGKALNDPIRGITALSRVGVNFTEQQKEQIRAMVEGGQTMEAQRLILAELGREFGGSAAAQAGTFAGKMAQLKNEMGDLLELIGSALVPVLEGLAAQLKPIVTTMMEWIKAHPELTKNITLVVAGIGAFLVGLGPLLIVLPGLVTVFSGLSTIIPIVGAVLAAVTGPIGLTVVAVAALVAGAIALITHWEDVKAFFSRMWDGIKAVFAGAIEAIGRQLGAGMARLVKFVTDPIGSIKAAWAKIVNVFKGAWQNLKEIGALIVNAVKAPFRWLDALLKKLGSLGGRGFAEGYQGEMVSGHALGGLTRTPLQIVGEYGPELVRLPKNTPVADAPTTRQMLSNATSAGNTVTVNIGSMTVRDQTDADYFAEQLSQKLGTQLAAQGVY